MMIATRILLKCRRKFQNFVARPYSDSGWNLLQGVFTVDAGIEAGKTVSFFVEGGGTGIMLLDTVSI
jgi:hypothetical protein